MSAVSSPKTLAETIEAAVVDFDLAAGDDTGFDAQQCDEIRKLLNLEAKDSFNVILETFNDFIKTSAEADNEPTLAVRVRCSGAWGHLSKHVARPQRCW